MFFRTTSNFSRQQALQYLSQHNATISQLQADISSGIAIDKTSDAPVEFRRITRLTATLEKLRAENNTLTDVEGQLNTSVTLLQQVNGLIVRAKSLAQQGVQATSQDERNALAVEVEGMLSSLQDIALSQSSGSYLYSGANSNQAPFEFVDLAAPGRVQTTNYVGGDEPSVAYVGERISINAMLPGDEVFNFEVPRGKVLVGNVGLKSGQGTDSMVSRATVQIVHDSTTYQNGSGVTPGISSAEDDTALGPMGANQLTLVDTSGTGDFGTVRLNNGDAIDWTRTSTDLVVTDENGRQLHLDTSNITAGFNGTVDVESLGSATLDGQTFDALTFSDQTLIDPVTGQQVHLDTTDVHRTGDTHLEFPGSSDIFETFHELIQDLRNDRKFTNDERTSALDRRIGALGSASDHILGVVGRQSANLQVIEQLENKIADLELDVETEVSELQSTDIPRAVLDLQQHQSLLEFTYSITASINSISILDFLR